MKRLLMVAFHYPPLAGSSGIQRALRFVQHLPAVGWEPLVLSAHPMAYERVSSDLDAVAPNAVVRRAIALDTARHFAIAGRYPGSWARPDRWISWKFDGVRQGMKLIQEFKPSAIWSTYPIATAHVIAGALHQRTGLPWIADFRDPMAQDGYPDDPLTWQSFKAIEQHAAARASACMFTTPSALKSYQSRYPHAAARMSLLENGYDEESFARIAGTTASDAEGPLSPGVITLLHSGIVYPSERDPTQLFAALALLKNGGVAAEFPLRVRFRAPIHDRLLTDLATRYDVKDMVEILPPVSYEVALREMLRADALLILQAANCNEQIPAKLYEYLRAGRPIVCLSDPAGDTCQVLRHAGIDPGARLDDAADIASFIERVLRRDRLSLLASRSAIASASREGRARQLAAQLDALTATAEVSA